jgi:hypothetical protein
MTTKLKIDQISIMGDERQFIVAGAEIVETTLSSVGLPKFTIKFSPEECEELKALIDRVIQRALSEIRKNV